MKKIICLLLSLLLAGSLLGCVAEANPGNTTLPTEATAASDQPTETLPLGDWESYAVSTLLPEPLEDWSVMEVENTSLVDIVVTSRQQAMDYVQQLKDTGFTYKSFEYMDQDGNFYSYDYHALNTDADGISVGYTEIHKDTGDIVYIFFVYFYSNQDVDATKDSIKAQEAWGADLNRAQVPEPLTVYWNGRNVIDGFSGNPLHRVELHGLTYNDVMEYAEQLQKAGFYIDHREKITPNGSYSYYACNAEGWWISLQRLATGHGETEMIAVLHISDTMPRYGDWGWQNSLDSYLPHPEQSWSITSWPNCAKIVLPEMTYQEALDYIQAIGQKMQALKQQTIDELGPDYKADFFRMTEDLAQDDTAQTIDYNAFCGYTVEGPDNFGFEVDLIYDPSNPEAPCILYIS